MDATRGVREFLLTAGVHDYAKQEKGEASRIYVETFLLTGGKIVETKTSLYRPKTKDGDPRIWVYELSKNAKPNDLLAITTKESKLVIVNCSRSNLTDLLNPQNLIYKELFSDESKNLNAVVEELLSKMNEIADRGFIPTLRPGDTGVGYTLETLLGISANSLRSPDYKGIELKSGRRRSLRHGRSTVFSQVPNWSISRVKGKSKELLYLRGRYNEEKKRMQLFHELSAIKTNSYNLRLEIDKENRYLHQIFIDGDQITRDVTWQITVLENRLREKHSETFWVSADTQGRSGDKDEKFHYRTAKYTGNADSSALGILIETGVITLDYTMKEVGKGGVKDQGYLFKIGSKNLNLLFERVENFELGTY